MAIIQSLPGFAASGWTRMQGAPLPALIVKSCSVLAVSLVALRLLSLG